MLNNKTIVIVGGSSGIGFSLACKAASEGADVIIAARSLDKLQEAQARSGHKLRIETVDARDNASVEDFFTRVGSFHHLVCTIKPKLPAASFMDDDIVEAMHAFDAKFWGQYRLAKQAMQRIERNGSIILTSGIASLRSYKGYAIVSAMNAAVEALARSIAVELAPVRVNVVCPGFVDTDPPSENRIGYVKNVAGRIPLDRLATPDEIADAYLYLMTNSYSTGSVIVADGGAAC